MSDERDRLALRQQTFVDEIRSFQTTAKTLNRNTRSDCEISLAFSEKQAEGLSIYQNNLKATAYRALSIAYPVLELLVGDQAMRLLAQQLIQQHPLRSGDWGDWGETLATLIATSELVDDYPFLTDIAVLEWKIHCANRSSNNNYFDRESLALLEQQSLDSVCIQLSNSTQRLSSPYPIDTIWQLHQAHNAQQQKALKAQLQQELDRPDRQYELLITRAEHQVQIHRLSDADAVWFSSVLAGSSLEALLTEQPTFDFSDWLKTAIENNYLSRFFTTQYSA